MAKSAAAKKITPQALQKMKRGGEPITMLTAYDATFAKILDGAGAEVLLVGDSLGMVFQGRENTLSVTVEEIIYHTRAVARGAHRAQIVADLPFMSYQTSLEEGVRNAGRLVKEGNAEAVKLEGGRRCADLVAHIAEVGIPVMGHIGLTPQSVHAMGGYRVQGRRRQAARALVEDALALQEAGAYAVVLEGIPREVAAQITECIEIPTIGIGAGPECDGQVLVIYDLLGMDEGFSPRFVKRYDHLGARIARAVTSYVEEVKSGAFPGPEHSFSRETRKKAGGSSATSAQDKRADDVEEADDGDLAETIPLYPGVTGK